MVEALSKEVTDTKDFSAEDKEEALRMYEEFQSVFKAFNLAQSMITKAHLVEIKCYSKLPPPINTLKNVLGMLMDIPISGNAPVKQQFPFTNRWTETVQPKLTERQIEAL